MRILSASVAAWIGGRRPSEPAVVVAARARAAAQALARVEGLSQLLEAERERWLLWAPVFFGLGAGIYFALPTEPDWLLTLGPLVAALGLKLAIRRGTLALALTGALVCLALGFTATKARTEWMRAAVVGHAHKALTLHGWVELIERKPDQGLRLTLRLSRVDELAADATPLRVRVRTPFDNLSFRAGDAIVVRAILQPPPEPTQPGGYDFARLAWFNGIGGVGFTISRPLADDTAPAMPAWVALTTSIERMREWVSGRITSALPGNSGAFADALITGERGGIPQEVTDALRDSGLSHILAISGFNMAIMAGALLGLTRALLAAFPRIALRWPVKKLSALAGLAGAAFCLLVSGAGSATTRSFIMIAIMLVAVMLDRPALSMRNLAIAALLLLVPAPETLLDVSFQMSFSAVVALMAAWELSGRGERSELRPLAARAQLLGGWPGHAVGLLRETVASTTIATLAVAPFATFAFHKIAIYGVLANIAAVPLFNLVIMPLVLLTLMTLPFGLEALPLTVLDRANDLLLWIARSVGSIDGAVVRLPEMPMSALVAMTLGGLWLCLWRRSWRYLGCVGIGAGLWLAAPGDRPEILVGREGSPVAVRLADGRLSAMPGPGTEFALSQWLETDADGRSPDEVASGEGFTCDAVGCTVRIGDTLAAISSSPAAVADDCSHAQIVIMRVVQAVPCRGPKLVLDLRDLRLGGARAIHVEHGLVSVRTVAEERGSRPWSMAWSPTAARRQSDAAALAEQIVLPVKASHAPKRAAGRATHKSRHKVAHAASPPNAVAATSPAAAPASATPVASPALRTASVVATSPTSQTATASGQPFHRHIRNGRHPSRAPEPAPLQQADPVTLLPNSPRPRVES